MTIIRVFNAPSNAVRDADLARIGTLTGPDRATLMANLLDRLPAYQNREASGDAARRQALTLAAMLASGTGSATMDPRQRSRMMADALGGQR